MAVMSLERWLEETHETFNFRGTELTAIDNALRDYHQTRSNESLRKLRVAFNAWTSKQGLNWEQSSRNGKGAFTKLNRQITEAQRDTPSAATLAFQKHISEARQDALKRIFLGKRLVMKTSAKAWTVQKVASVAQDSLKVAKVSLPSASIAPSASSVPEPVKKIVYEAVKQVFDADQVEEVVAFLGINFMNQLVTSVAPFVGHIKSGGKALVEWAKTARSQYRLSDARDHQRGLLKGDPREACAGLIEILERDRNEHATKASMATAELGARTVASFLDGGAATGSAIGLASSISNLMHQVYLLGREYRDLKAANALLAQATSLDRRLFTANPLLGAYYIWFGETSDLVAILADDLGTQDWMDEVEFINSHHIARLKELSLIVMNDARFEIENMPYPPAGLVDRMARDAKKALTA